MKVAEYEKMMIALEKEVEDAIKDFEEEVKKTGEALGTLITLHVIEFILFIMVGM